VNISATIAIFPSRTSPYVVLDVERIRAAMERHCLSATELAVEAGVSILVVNRILHAKPVQRHKATMVINTLLAATEVEGIGFFLSDTKALAS
jgi:transcriptional regulator with XRE-family HTH domain